MVFLREAGAQRQIQLIFNPTHIHSKGISTKSLIGSYLTTEIACTSKRFMSVIIYNWILFQCYINNFLFSLHRLVSHLRTWLSWNSPKSVLFCRQTSELNVKAFLCVAKRWNKFYDVTPFISYGVTMQNIWHILHMPCNLNAVNTMRLQCRRNKEE